MMMDISFLITILSKANLHLAPCSLLLLNWFVVWREVQADTVDAVPLIGGGREAFALEYMAQVTTAVGTDDLGAYHEVTLILVASHRAGDAVKICRPAAARLELVGGLVQGRVASCACVDAV